jgi:hypothetical protein
MMLAGYANVDMLVVAISTTLLARYSWFLLLSAIIMASNSY